MVCVLFKHPTFLINNLDLSSSSIYMSFSDVTRLWQIQIGCRNGNVEQL